MENTKKIAWVVWLLASIFYAYQFVIRVMPSIIMNDIMLQYNINAALFGQFSGVYYIGYSLLHLPIGIMLDRFGVKKVMSGCILLTVIGMLPILYCNEWVYPVIGRFLIGIGSSAAILGAFKIIRMTFQEAHFSRMLSLTVTIGLIGAIYGGAPVSYLADHYGYKMLVKIFALSGIALAVLTYFIVPKQNEILNQQSILDDIKIVLMNKKVVFLCVLAGFMVGPLEGFADVWGARYLYQVYGLDKSQASYLPSMIFIGMCFGGPLLSLIVERTGKYIATIIGAGIIMLSIFTFLLLGILNFNSITVSFCIIGICCAYQILAIYKASTYVPENVAGLTTAIANMIIMIFGYFFHSVIGYVVNLFGGIQNTKSFTYGIAVIPSALIIATLGLIILNYWENKTKKIVV